jgi:hypothetical protein
MFKISHLNISKFDFILLCLFRTKNHNEMSILPLTPKLKLHHFENGIVLELGKIAIFCTEGQSERKPKFDTPK